jgi:hypothetical protein
MFCLGASGSAIFFIKSLRSKPLLQSQSSEGSFCLGASGSARGVGLAANSCCSHVAALQTALAVSIQRSDLSALMLGAGNSSLRHILLMLRANRQLFHNERAGVNGRRFGVFVQPSNR